eukprot:GHUV01019671.1.p1 GENE.GHUV01019671.1~~GHUV01019671.1.p1  ORF type:complete len:191 (+),score=61.01 GHUV01019671.1:2-574(+)
MYLAGDQASDMITYSKLHSQAMELVAKDDLIPQMIGAPYSSGAWYDATLAFSHRDKVAHCTFQLKGSRGVTDIAVKGGRQPGYRSNILYNMIGPGVWQLLSCQVMVPSEGGLVAPRSLMPEHKEQPQQQSGRAASCQPCQEQQQQPGQLGKQHTDAQLQQQPADEHRRWYHRLWWRQRQQQQEAAAQRPT